MFGSGSLGFGLRVFLDNDYSRPAEQVRQSMGGLDRQAQQSAQNVQAAMGRMQSGFGQLLGAGALLAPFGVAVASSARLSDALADVTKTTGLTGPALQALRGELESLNTRTSVRGLLEMAKAGGSMGVAQKDISGFTAAVDKLNVALGDQFPDPESLARQLTKMRNVLKDVQTDNVGQDLLHIGNVLNFMGANAAATEGDIANIVSRMSGLGQTLGLSSGQIFGVSTALSEMGVNAEVAGSNFPLILQRMSADIGGFAKVAGIGAGEFRQMVNTDIMGAFQMVALGAKQMAPTASSMSTLLKSLKLPGARVAEVFLKAADNTDLLTQRVQEANQALGGTGSVMGEFNAKNETLAAVLEKTQKRAGILVTRIGDSLAPAVRFMAGAAEGLLQVLAGIVSSPLGRWMTYATVGGMALLGGLMAIHAVAFQLLPAFRLLARSALVMGRNFLLAFGPQIAVIAAVAGAVYLVYQGVKSFQDLMNGGAAETGIMGFFQRVGGVILAVGQIWRSWNGETFELSEGMYQALQRIGILDFVLNLATYVVRVKEFMGGMADQLVANFNTVRSWITRVYESIRPFLSTVQEMFFSVEKAASGVDQWRGAGEGFADFVSGTLLFILGLLIIKMGALAISVAAATWPILAIGAALYGVYELIRNWGTITEWIGEKVMAATGFIKDKFVQIVDWMAGLPMRAVNAGRDLVLSLRDGMASSWSRFTSWLSQAWQNLMGSVPGLSGLMNEMFGEPGGVSGGGGSLALSTGTGGLVAQRRGLAAERSRAFQPAAGGGREVVREKELQSVQVNLNLDGQQIGEQMIRFDEQEDYRN